MYQMVHIFYFQTENQNMNSSDDELPDIPGTRYPWMADDAKQRSSDGAGPSNAYKRYFYSLWITRF